jgi:hypothetical protein
MVHLSSDLILNIINPLFSLSLLFPGKKASVIFSTMFSNKIPERTK